MVEHGFGKPQSNKPGKSATLSVSQLTKAMDDLHAMSLKPLSLSMQKSAELLSAKLLAGVPVYGQPDWNLPPPQQMTSPYDECRNADFDGAAAIPREERRQREAEAKIPKKPKRRLGYK